MRGRRGEAGFGVSEALMVCALLAIAAVVVVANVAARRDGDRDGVAQRSLRLALSAAKILYVDGRTYAPAGPAGLRSVEPALQYLQGDRPSSNPDEVSVEVGPGPSTWAASARSASGRCFFVRDVATSGSTYGAGDGPCTGRAAARLAGGSFFP